MRRKQGQQNITSWRRALKKGDHTVRAVALDHPAHAQGGSALEERAGDDGVGPGDGLAAARNGQNTVVDALDNLADARLDACLVAQIGHVLAAFPNDDARLLGRDNGAQRQLCLGIFFIGLGRGLSVGAKAGLIEVELVEGVAQVGAVVRKGVLRGRHCGRGRVSRRKAKWWMESRPRLGCLSGIGDAGGKRVVRGGSGREVVVGWLVWEAWMF